MGRLIAAFFVIPLMSAAGYSGTHAPIRPPAAGCYDSTTYADIEYSGVPNVVDNVDNWSSTDGSCRDLGVGDVSNSTLVLAPNRTAANAACRKAGLGDASERWVDAGYYDMPANAWVCPYQIIK